MLTPLPFGQASPCTCLPLDLIVVELGIVNRVPVPIVVGSIVKMGLLLIRNAVA